MAAIQPNMGTEYTDDKKDYIPTTTVYEVEHSAEYTEFLALADVFKGEKYKRLTRKIDWRLIPQTMLIYMISYIDRGNVGNAKVFGAIKDLHMTNQQWNTGLTVFFATYALAGPPTNILLKRFGPKKVLPTILTAVSIILIGSGCANSPAQWYALRLLLGVFEAGMFPGCVYTFTTWYTPEEIHSRINLFYCGATLASAFGGLFAYAIGQADGKLGYRGWRWIYVMEGVMSFLIATSMYYFLQDRPQHQGKWLDSEERRYLLLRSKYLYGKDQSGNSTDFVWKDIKRALKSYHVYILGFVFFAVSAANYGLTFTLPTVMTNMGFSAANAQLVSAPPYIFATIVVIILAWYADKYKRRMLSVAIPGFMGFAGLLVAVCTVKHKNLIPLTYIGICFGAAGGYGLSPGIAAWVSLNTAGQTKRAAAISLIVFFSQLGGIVSSNTYIASESPSYPTGFGVSLSMFAVGCVIVPVIYSWLIKRENARREAMSVGEVNTKYTAQELQDMGDLSPLYRYER